jgi:hypothetical protein
MRCSIVQDIWQNEAKSNCVGEIRRYAGSLCADRQRYLPQPK